MGPAMGWVLTPATDAPKTHMVGKRAVRIQLVCFLVWPNFPEKCMKIKKNGTRGRAKFLGRSPTANEKVLAFHCN